jgi:dolichyl-phosphate-mannose--protein O-mannosyl transferase
MSRFSGLVLLAAGMLTAGFTQAQDEKPKYYHIVSLDTGKVVDVVDGSADNGAKIVVNAKGKSESQQWKMVKVGDHVKFVNRKSGRVLDVPELSKDEGVEIIQWDDNGGENQQWTVEKAPKDKADKGNVIKSRCSGLVLDVAGESQEDGASVIQWGLHGKKNQLWELVEVK